VHQDLPEGNLAVRPDSATGVVAEIAARAEYLHKRVQREKTPIATAGKSTRVAQTMRKTQKPRLPGNSLRARLGTSLEVRTTHIQMDAIFWVQSWPSVSID